MNRAYKEVERKRGRKVRRVGRLVRLEGNDCVCVGWGR